MTFSDSNETELIIYGGNEESPMPWDILAKYNASTIKTESTVIATYSAGQPLSAKFYSGSKDLPSNRADRSSTYGIQFSIVALNMTIFNNTEVNITGVYDMNLTQESQPFSYSTYGFPRFYAPKTDETFRYFPMDSNIQIVFYATSWGSTFENDDTALVVYTGDAVDKIDPKSVLRNYTKTDDFLLPLLINPIGKSLSVKFTTTAGSKDYGNYGVSWFIIPLGQSSQTLQITTPAPAPPAPTTSSSLSNFGFSLSVIFLSVYLCQ
ncbi:hypothetical protein FO519_003988 [Halicephalobus sp. NKZ332]|nr:hypothetical protein FO519_003988 [Halicephalobus sp. NKZ332]